MNTRQLPLLCIASAATLLAACSAAQAPATQASAAAIASSTLPLLGNAVDHVLDHADEKLRTGDIELSERRGTYGYPDAKISPQGDLLIGGKAVALTRAQRDEVLAYRQQLVEIAEAGMAVGRQGAALGTQAASVAMAAAFSGQSKQQIRQQVEAQATGIRMAAAKICDRLPALMVGQQKLADAVPAFKPYASLTQKDIDDCRKDALHDGDTSRADTQPSVRDRIRGGIRWGIQAAAQSAGLASRGTPDASSATSAGLAQ